MKPVPEPQSLDAAYFERVYAAKSDPWDFATSPYEREKYTATLDALAGRRFARGFEAGCSIGVLTERLADTVEALLAVDVNEVALQQARSRCARRPNVRFARMALPHEFPDGRFDFALLSEIGYYWSREDLALAIERFASCVRGGTLELVHYLPKVEDYPLAGDDVHEAFLSDSRYSRVAGSRAARYRIDVLAVNG
jgi:SAM-dependent methyltransferase